MTKKLAQCPCGRIPDTLIITESGQGAKYAHVYGNCCGEWTIEFRTYYQPLNSDKCMELSIYAWNNAPRGNK